MKLCFQLYIFGQTRYYPYFIYWINQGTCQKIQCTMITSFLVSQYFIVLNADTVFFSKHRFTFGIMIFENQRLKGAPGKWVQRVLLDIVFCMLLRVLFYVIDSGLNKLIFFSVQSQHCSAMSIFFTKYILLNY